MDILIAMDEELYLPVMTCLDNKVRIHVWEQANETLCYPIRDTTRLNMEAINNAVREQMQRP